MHSDLSACWTRQEECETAAGDVEKFYTSGCRMIFLVDATTEAEEANLVLVETIGFTEANLSKRLSGKALRVKSTFSQIADMSLFVRVGCQL